MPREIDRNELQELRANGAQLVEVLPRDEYEDQHLPGATNIPLRDIDVKVKDRLDTAKAVVVYCWDTT
jgi:rhodanese-related sulfurtransferase